MPPAPRVPRLRTHIAPHAFFRGIATLAPPPDPGFRAAAFEAPRELPEVSRPESIGSYCLGTAAFRTRFHTTRRPTKRRRSGHLSVRPQPAPEPYMPQSPESHRRASPHPLSVVRR